MPARSASIALTARYQHKLRELQHQAQTRTVARWTRIHPGDIEATYQAWAPQAAAAITALQRAAVTLSAAYLTAYTRSETGRPVAANPPTGDAYVGVTRAGLTITEMLDSTLAGILSRIADASSDVDFAEATSAALTWGRTRNSRMAGDETTGAARRSLHDTLDANADLYAGWRRIAGPGASAVCLAAADGTIKAPSEPLLEHPFCTCVAQPVVRGLPDTVVQPAGAKRFAALPEAEQDRLAGPGTAKLIRDGTIPFSAIVATFPMAAQPDALTQRPLKDLIPA